MSVVNSALRIAQTEDLELRFSSKGASHRKILVRDMKFRGGKT
jgi:hypothetical protein